MKRKKGKIYRRNNNTIDSCTSIKPRKAQFRNCYPLNQFVSLKTLFHFLYSNYSLSFATLDVRFANIEYTAGNRTTFFQPTWPEIYETRYPLDSEIFERFGRSIKYFRDVLFPIYFSSRLVSWKKKKIFSQSEEILILIYLSFYIRTNATRDRNC